MIFDICLILLGTLLTALASFSAGALCMRDGKDKKKKSDGWEGILNYDHKRGGEDD